MIRGYCIGGGLGLAVCCDLRICADNSRFAVPAAKLGLGYGYAGVKRLVDVVGPAFAKEIFFTARQFDAEEARAMGLVNRVVPDAELEDYVKDYADTIAANAPLTVKTAKYIVGEAHEGREQARPGALRRAGRRSASPATTTSRAAAPSWRSASRHSPGRDRRRSRRQAVRMPTHGRASMATARAAGSRGKREARAWRPLNCAV